MQNKGKILIIDDVHLALVDGLKALNWEVDYFPDISVTKVPEMLSSYCGLIVRSKMTIHKSLIDQGSSLKFIARAGAGMDNIDEAYANSKGIICINAPEGNRDAVADHVLMLMLALLRNLKKSILQVGQSIWDREGNRGEEISSKTVGIIGYGNNGQALAKRLEPLAQSVLVYDKYKDINKEGNIIPSSLNEIFEHADIVSLHVPLTEETMFWVDKDFINRFKKSIYLVNASRGRICKESDLVQLLENKKILGLALDVLENEDLNGLNEEEKNRFLSLSSNENVLITPHIAGWTFESYNKISKVLLEKISLIN